jgi:hypothetical protein
LLIGSDLQNSTRSWKTAVSYHLSEGIELAGLRVEDLNTSDPYSADHFSLTLSVCDILWLVGSDVKRSILSSRTPLSYYRFEGIEPAGLRVEDLDASGSYSIAHLSSYSFAFALAGLEIMFFGRSTFRIKPQLPCQASVELVSPVWWTISVRKCPCSSQVEKAR